MGKEERMRFVGSLGKKMFDFNLEFIAAGRRYWAFVCSLSAHCMLERRSDRRRGGLGEGWRGVDLRIE